MSHKSQDIQVSQVLPCCQVVSGGVADCQLGAWLMAVVLRGLTGREVSWLTAGMVGTGARLSWPDDWAGRMVDKHSTGGVGDKVSLVLAPALAAVGLKVLEHRTY